MEQVKKKTRHHYIAMALLCVAIYTTIIVAIRLNAFGLTVMQVSFAAQKLSVFICRLLTLMLFAAGIWDCCRKVKDGESREASVQNGLRYFVLGVILTAVQFALILLSV